MAVNNLQQTVARIVEAPSWDERVQEIRRIPEIFGQQRLQAVYAAVAEAVYRPHLAPQFAYVQWRDEHELVAFQEDYDRAHELTSGFERVDPPALALVLAQEPRTSRIFRAIIGYTPGELAVAASLTGEELGLGRISTTRVKAMEAGRPPSEQAARACAEAIHRLITGTMWGVATGDLRSKIEKPDTERGWESVRELAAQGVPYSVLLHQRHYGGAFRTLLDSTSTQRGDVLEDPLEQLLIEAGVSHLRTGARNQREITARFGLTVRPAPDFVIFEGQRTLRAMIECKQANDGGTARDKAARFRTLANEGTRLGGVPVFALLDGLGWQRTADALGPVVRDTDGRVFTLETLEEMLTVEPLPGLVDEVQPE